MPRAKTLFVCSECGYEAARWVGKCPSCESWNTMEEQEPAAPASKSSTFARGRAAAPAPVTIHTPAPFLRDIEEEDSVRTRAGIDEFDRVLGGGIVKGSLVLIGGDPGIGKSTLLLQVADLLCGQEKDVLYVTGEESQRQIRMRAQRLGVSGGDMRILAETDLDQVIGQMHAVSPDFMIVDSIQTMYRPSLNPAPGSVSQVRECTSALMRAAKDSGCAIFLVGHVTKEGSLAGPKVLEHMVDAVLYFEGDRHQQYRILRAAKNRYGSINEIGIFEMHDTGMRQVPNPSEFLLSGRQAGATGSAVACAMEGSRPVLCDLQALVSPSAASMPRRQAYGFDYNRVALLLAVLEKRAGIPLYNQDAYINVAGGLELSEPAADLPLIAAVYSSAKNRALPTDWAVFGEVGLTGEVRAVSQVERRLNECARMGFSACMLPRYNLKGLKAPQGLTLHGVDTVSQAIALFHKHTGSDK